VAVTNPDTRILPVDRTLTRVVLLMRLLGGAWLLIIAVVVLAGTPQNNENLRVPIVIGLMAIATAGTALTFVAAKRRFLGEPWYVLLDSAITLSLAVGGWVAGHQGFIVGGYPASLLFVVAYATGFRLTVLVGMVGTLVMGYLHIVMDLSATRTFGSVQYVIVAAVVGWAFENLRERELMRLAAEDDRAEAQRELAEEQRKSARLQERSMIARQLHDSVLQTLKLISASAEEPGEVRYLARVQERDLRRTINEYQSPFEDSFRARLLDARAEIEDRYRVEIEQVVKDDAEMDEPLRAVVSAAAEAMNNAARHSGVSSIDLFAEIRDGKVRVHVRDRGSGFDPDVAGTGIRESIRERIADVGGTAEIKTAPGRGTEVQILLPLP
jgi:signal transduction histidine kinase